MKKRISDFLLDVSKYVLAGVLIAPLFNVTACENASYWYIFVIAILAFVIGLFLSHQKKGMANKNNNNRNKSYRNKNNNNKNNAIAATNNSKA
ncbi:MAG: DUF6722 family protein [Capnocytophaga sp.]|uniref:DUF6722 family protein n=1 Tax=Capnocytophaga sp. TaxID=44737 RepID=UPI003FA045E8